MTHHLPLDEIRARYQSGESCEAIARDHQVGAQTVGRRLRRMGIALRPTCPKKHLPVDLIHARYMSGETLECIAADFGVASQTVGRRLLEAGVALRPSGGRPGVCTRKPLIVDEAALRQLASQGMSTREIGAALGISEETARNRMIQWGIPRLAAKARPERNGFWNGGRTRDKSGYIRVHCPSHPTTSSNYVQEHRLVAEAMLGRLLERQEVVDHRNFVVDDNRPENLQVYPTNAEHLRDTLTGLPKTARCRRQFPRGGPTPSARETGALQSLLSHPLGLFAPDTAALGL